MGQTQRVQHLRTGGDIHLFYRKRACRRLTKSPLCGLFFGIADLGIGFVQCFVFRKSDDDIIRDILDLRVLQQFFILLPGEKFKASVGPGPHLSHGRLLHGIDGTHADGKYTRKEHRGQNNGNHSDDVTCFTVF